MCPLDCREPIDESMGITRPDLFKQLKLMADAGAIVSAAAPGGVRLGWVSFHYLVIPAQAGTPARGGLGMSNGAEWLRPKFSANATGMGPSLRWDDEQFLG